MSGRAGRKTSSPLSSPSSSATRLPRQGSEPPAAKPVEGTKPSAGDLVSGGEEEAQGEEREREGEGVELPSPVTSSTLPLTDDEVDSDSDDEDGEGEEGEPAAVGTMRRGYPNIRLPRAGYGDADEESELTEEDDDEEEEQEHVEVEGEDEEEEEVEDGPEQLSISKGSAPSHSAASTGSLTPPPSDPLPTSPLPKIRISPKSLKAHAQQQEPSAEEGEEEEEEEDEDDDNEDEDGDGDVTMRAEPPDPDIKEEVQGTNADSAMLEAAVEEEANVEVKGDDGELAESRMDEEIDQPSGAGADPEAEIVAEVSGDADLDGDQEEEVEIEVNAEVDADAEVEQEQEGDEEAGAADSPAYLAVPSGAKGHHTSHATLPTAASMRALLTLEVKFAALRDRLYIERMQEAAAEEEMILNGTHPTLQYLYKTLSERREKLHEVASRRHQQTVAELKRVREAEQNLVWSSWTTDRDSLHWDEFEHTWSKRRRLAREKNEIEMPRITKPVPRVGQPSSVRYSDWSAGVTPVQLGRDEAANDLALMASRPVQLSRHASPAVYGQQPLAAQYNVAGSSTVSAPNASSIYSAYPDPVAHVTSQHVFAPTRTNPTQAPPHSHSSSQSPGARLPPSQPQRREGRTVPTTSDLFDGPRRTQQLSYPSQTANQATTKDVKSPPIQGSGGGMNGSAIVSHGLWGRQVGLGTGDKMLNGHGHGHSHSSPLGAGGSIGKDSTPPSLSAGTTPTALTPGTSAAVQNHQAEQKSHSQPSISSHHQNLSAEEKKPAVTSSKPPPPSSTAAATASAPQAQHQRDRDEREPVRQPQMRFHNLSSLSDFITSSTSTPGANGGLYPLNLGVGMGVSVGGTKSVLSPPQNHSIGARSPFGTAMSNGTPTPGSVGGGTSNSAQPGPGPTATTVGTEARSR